MTYNLTSFLTQFLVSSHMYPEDPAGTQLIVGSMNMGYVSLLRAFLSISYSYWDIWLRRFQGLTLTFDLEKSTKVKNIFVFRSPYMTSYVTHVDIFPLSVTVFEIFDFEVYKAWPWPLTFRSYLRSKISSPFGSLHRYSYLSPIDTFSISYSFWDIWTQIC